MIIDGKAHVEHSNQLLKSMIQDKVKDRSPKLVIISVGDNPASKVYMRNKAKACEKVGIECELVHFNTGVKQSALVEEIDYQNHRGDVDGIIVQLPLPEGYSTEYIINQISPQKDVDCLTEANLGKLYNVNFLTRMPCTPNAVLDLLWENNITVAGKRVVILGRSNLVGKPLAVIMSSRFVDATVTLCHSQTENLADICRTADILISAVGKPRFVTADMVKPGAVVIDVAINRDENGKLCGDVDFDNVAPRTSAITPVPGGVGPVTVSCLLWNTYNAYLQRKNHV